MKASRLMTAGILLITNLFCFGQKTISEGTVVYDITMEPKNSAGKVNSALSGAKTTFYLKGGLSRMDMTSSLGTETTIYNAKNAQAVILKEYSGQKLMITLTKENWDSRNKRFDGMVFHDENETKTIAGYNCKKAVSKSNDGSTIVVYYTPDLITLNKDYSQLFKSLQGFPIEYELENEKMRFKYRLSSIDFDPVSPSRFEFPKAGYRVLTFDESKKGAGTVAN